MIYSCKDLKLNKLTGQISDEIGDCISFKCLYAPKSKSFVVCTACLFFCRMEFLQLASVFSYLCRDLTGNLLYGDIPFSVSKLKQLEDM
jgi:hypothetical protein